MEVALNENFISFCKYLGTGNINSKIWFVGIEEGGEAVTEKNLSQQLAICEKETRFLDDSSDNTPVWNTISELLYEKFFNNHQLKKHFYRQQIFSNKYPYFFLTELLPLPKSKTTDWPNEYYKIFGYNKNDYYRYLSDVRWFRYPNIFNEWDKTKPSITICFGSTFWNEFINLFKLGHSAFVKLSGLNILKYPKENIILTPFFGNGAIKREERMKLKELINNTSV